MRKWIVLNKGEYDLVAAWHEPAGNVVEVPDNFNRDMVPFISIGEVQDGPHKRIAAVLDQAAYKEHIAEGHAAKAAIQSAKDQALTKAIARHVEVQSFNKMNPGGRVLKSFLGAQHEPFIGLLKKIGPGILATVFKPKLPKE